MTPPRPSSSAGPVVAVAATFTAEPLAPYLEFWLQALWGGGAARFAPFDQVHQQVLDPTSALRGADAGMVLVRPAEWLAPQPRAAGQLPEIAGLQRHRLADGLEVYHLNRYETDYVHHEIFVDRAYLRHGITLGAHATVIDIGANIGLFTLFVLSHAPESQVIALEPSPLAFAALEANVARYGDRVTALPYGASDRDGTATFTAYTRSSVFSGFHADPDADRAAIRAVIHNVVRGETATSDPEAEALADALVADRLEAKVVDVPVRALSSVLAQVGAGDIDLLKIDAEKSETAVLAGITPSDWARIRQVVIEVHDTVGERARAVRQLLEAHGFTVTSDQEALLAGSGLHNFYGVRATSRQWAVPAAEPAPRLVLPAQAQELVSALRAAAPSLTAPLTLVCCPVPDATPDAAALDTALAEALADVPSVSVVPVSAWVHRYVVDQLHDRRGDADGRVPYTADGYAALATTLARGLWSTRQPRAKVIVVDADHTLWHGVLAEDGLDAVTIGPGRAALHRCLLAQRETGVLLAVCSKNDAADLLRALADHPDSLVRPDHLSAHAIGWTAKSAGVRAIAADLGVGLDSLVFLDDNPAECAEVAAGCPGVVTWCVPTDDRELPAFLEHLWPLDARRVTSEDRRRADLYRDERARQAFHASAASYQAFIDGLELTVDVAPVDAGTLPRALQLFERTNQFNFTTWRPTEADLHAAMARGLELQVVRVADRFGDYGLTGVVALRADGAALCVEAFLLSCRVLGKGVEHRVLAHVGRQARERDLADVRVAFRPSPRNEPARRFADSLAVATPAGDDRLEYVWAAASAAAIVFTPSPASPPHQHDDDRPAAHPAPHGPGARALEVLSRLPVMLRTAAAIRRAAQRAQGTTASVATTPTERRLAAIWAECLRFDEVGVDEDFFALGGDSIVAVMIASRAHREGLPVTPREVLAHATIRQLAATLTSAAPAAAVTPAAARPSQFEVSPMQAMYFAQYVAGLHAGFEQCTLTIRGRLEVDRLCRAWQRVVDRHDALRSSFHEVAGRVVQRIVATATMPIATLDWRGLAVTEQTARLRQLVDADRAQRFDLACAPLTRLTTIRMAEDDWRVCWSFHHLIADGWSWPLIAADLADAYAAPDVVPAPAPSCAAFAAYLARRSPGDDDTYWQETLRGVQGHGLAPRATTTDVTAAHGLDENTTEALARAARRHRTTLGALVAGAWAVVVADECGVDDVVIGVATSGRPADLSDADRTVGTFVVNVPLRVACTPQLGLATWLPTVQRGLAEAVAHQFLPPDRLQAASGLAVGQRLFDSLVIVQNYAGAGDAPLILGSEPDGPRVTAVDFPVRTGLPVSVVVTPGTRLSVSVGGRLREIDAERWLAAFVRVLTTLAASGDTTLAAVRQPRALPRAHHATMPHAASRVAPAGSPLETLIATVWGEVLGHSAFGGDDNFFELGGHSLSMLAVQTRLSARMGRPLSIVDLFQYPTIRALATRLSDAPDDHIVGAAHARAARQRQALTRGRPVGVRP